MEESRVSESKATHFTNRWGEARNIFQGFATFPLFHASCDSYSKYQSSVNNHSLAPEAKSTITAK